MEQDRPLDAESRRFQGRNAGSDVPELVLPDIGTIVA
jgi:hypothetical protein